MYVSVSDDDSSDSDTNDEAIEEVDDTPIDVGSPTNLSDSSGDNKDLEKSHGVENRDSAFDIIKELQADMDFDKASQDSLERDLNIKVPDLGKMAKNESDEALDIDDLLSCLKTEEYKIASSENESVKSEGGGATVEKRSVRGKTKTKGELKARPDAVKLAKTSESSVKTKTDTAKAKHDAFKSKSELSKLDETKSPQKMLQPKIEIAKLKSDVLKTTEPSKSKLDASKSKSDSSVHKLKADSRTRQELSKVKSPEATKIKTESEQNDDKSDELTASSDKTKQHAAEKVTSSSDEQSTVTDKPSRGRPRKDKDSDQDKEDRLTTSASESTPTKTRTRGRGKRKVDKEEVMDSEDEPLKKKSRKKTRKAAKEDNEEESDKPLKMSSPSGDDLSNKEESAQLSSQESTGWIPELTATPKLTLEDLAKQEAADNSDEAAPPLSPININAGGVSTTSMGQSEGVSSYDLRGAMETTVPPGQMSSQQARSVTTVSAVEDTPPHTPENNAANQTPHHDTTYEASSTKSEMEANLEVEKFLQGARPPGENSPSVYDPSNVSTASDESVNQDKVAESELTTTLSNTSNAGVVKRKTDDQTSHVKKKRGKKGPQKTKQDPKRACEC